MFTLRSDAFTLNCMYSFRYVSRLSPEEQERFSLRLGALRVKGMDALMMANLAGRKDNVACWIRDIVPTTTATTTTTTTTERGRSRKWWWWLSCYHGRGTRTAPM